MNTPNALICDTVTSTQRFLITFTVMLATIIEILDMTIVNVALPPMMGDLSASTDQITWVLTSYIVASAVIIPLTGFLVAQIGRRKLLLIDIAGFLVASMLCGTSTSMAEIVFFRVLQGIFGASLVPMSQYILGDIFPKADRGKAMAIWGIGIMVAPILGPTLGGYIVGALNWRWIFYINIPVCLIAFFLALQFIPETETKRIKIDWLGLLLMAIGIGCLQVFLDRGNTNGWFNSNLIMFLFVTWIFALSIFFVRGFRVKNNIINLQLLKNKNLTIATVILTVFGAAMFGIVTVLPMMLEHLMGYTPELAGLFMAPRAIATAFGMFFSAKLIKKMDMRIIVGLGVLLTAYSSYAMCEYNLQSSFYTMLWPTCLNGFAGGLFFVPLSSTALASLSPQDSAEGAGLFNFGRNLGGSIGISLLSTLITRESQINWTRLTSRLTESNTAFQHFLQTQGLNIHRTADLQIILNELGRQSMMVAFLDAYFAVAVSLVLMLPLIFFIKTKN